MLILASLLILSAMIMTITFAFSSATLDLELFESYFSGGLLLFMNFLPIFLIMTFIYLISNRLWLGYSLTALIFTIMGIANRLKLTYRDDPITFSDLGLLGESMEMSKTYDLSLTRNIMLMLGGLILVGILLKIFLKPKINSKKIRIGLMGALLVLSVFIFKDYYFSPKVYAQVGDTSIINEWIESEKYRSKGLVYPFIYSAKDMKIYPPEGYVLEEAKEILEKNTYKDIPQDEKVNIIGIMLEAYNDFSEFEGVDLGIDIYEKYHKLEEESLSGKIITNVFAGGTINTERGFITGYNAHPKIRKKTNSYIRYFNEQGYRTEAMHPLTGSFYNRISENDYLGFDKFDHYDNKYREVQYEPLGDDMFFDHIIEAYENSKKDKKPYMNFSVTYQNHGPYSHEKLTEKEYLVKKDHYNEEDYNIVNNYMDGINGTGEALEDLMDYFREEDEPTIIVLFGDHNPWLGIDNSAYDMLGIDLDLSNLQGFKNYYQTPYLIWGNPKAKESLNKDFIGEAPTISPNLLMTELFDYLGWEGNEFMQYTSEMKKTIDVNHDLYFKENGEYKESLSEEGQKLWDEYIKVEHYYSQNYRGD